MKRYLVLLIALTMVFSLSIGVYGAADTAPAVMKLDLEQAYKLLETNNLDIKLLDKKIEMKLNDNEDLIDTIKDIKGMNSTYESTELQYRKTESLSYRQATLELDALYNERKEKFQSLKIGVKQQYVALLLQQENIRYVKQDIEVMDKRMKEIQLRVQLGQVKDSEYKSMYSQSLSLQNQLNALNTQYETSLINFKMLLGIELSQSIEIQNYVLPNASVNKETIKTDIAKAMENEFSIQKLNRQIELKKIEIDLVKKYTDAKFSSEYRDLQVELDELQTELSQLKLSTEADLMIEYYNLLVMEDKVKLEELNLEIAKLNYDSTVARAKLGLVNSVTEINASISYNKQKTNLQNTKNNYILAVEQFKQNLNLQ